MKGHDPKDPRINVYICDRGHHTVTVDVGFGVTPFMIGCQTEGCDCDARSLFYPTGPKPDWIAEPTHEWYQPITTDGLEEWEKSHVLKWGLLLRPRTDALPILHGEVS